MSNSGAAFETVWPRGKQRQKLASPAPRIPDLSGKTIGILWNYVFRGEEIFPLLEREIAKKFPGVKFKGADHFGNTHSESEREVLANLPAKLKELGVDAVISGNGC